MLWRLYEIKYESSRTDLPSEIHVDLDDLERFPWMRDIKVDPLHPNLKVFRAIKEITGCRVNDCKIEILKKFL
jgi:hypothetical protein